MGGTGKIIGHNQWKQYIANHKTGKSKTTPLADKYLYVFTYQPVAKPPKGGEKEGYFVTFYIYISFLPPKLRMVKISKVSATPKCR